MNVATTTITVNPAFLQEIKQDNEELRRLLLQLDGYCRGQCPPPEGRQRLTDLLDRLRDQLALHFSLEEAYGYFDDSVAGQPDLSNRADALRNQHSELYSELNSLVDHAKDLLDDHGCRTVCRRIRKGFSAFHDRLHRHEDRENELILDAFDRDVGVCD